MIKRFLRVSVPLRFNSALRQPRLTQIGRQGWFGIRVYPRNPWFKTFPDPALLARVEFFPAGEGGGVVAF